MSISVFIFLIFSSVFSATWDATITPPNEAGEASVYTVPGFNWRTCRLTEECRTIAWPKRGDRVKVLEGVEIEGLRYYRLEYNSPKGKKIGYVEESYLLFTAGRPNCEKRGIGEFLAATGDVLSSFFSSRARPDVAVSLPQLSDVRVYSPKCKNFIDENGELGPWGVRLLNAFEEVDPICFFDRIDVSNVCPNFKNFSRDRKGRWWNWLVLNKAQDEASCRVEAQAAGVNGTADGLMQLEYSYALRKASGRNPRYCRTEGPSDTQDLTFQFECTASIIKDEYCDKNRPLVNPRGYWQNLNRANRWIAQRAAEFPGCR